MNYGNEDGNIAAGFWGTLIIFVIAVVVIAAMMPL